MVYVICTYACIFEEKILKFSVVSVKLLCLKLFQNNAF